MKVESRKVGSRKVWIWNVGRTQQECMKISRQQESMKYKVKKSEVIKQEVGKQESRQNMKQESRKVGQN